MKTELSACVASGRKLELGMRETIEASQDSCKRYAICSLPRSGSFLLCEMLRSVGLGDPREHLRPPILKFLDRSPEDDFDLVEWYQRVNSLARKNGVFGTKLISHFIFDWAASALNRPGVSGEPGAVQSAGAVQRAGSQTKMGMSRVVRLR